MEALKYKLSNNLVKSKKIKLISDVVEKRARQECRYADWRVRCEEGIQEAEALHDQPQEIRQGFVEYHNQSQV